MKPTNLILILIEVPIGPTLFSIFTWDTGVCKSYRTERIRVQVDHIAIGIVFPLAGKSFNSCPTFSHVCKSKVPNIGN